MNRRAFLAALAALATTRFPQRLIATKGLLYNFRDRYFAVTKRGGVSALYYGGRRW